MPRIVYLSWPAGEVAGGIKATYQHAGLLADAGREAVVVTRDGVQPWWFETTAPTEPLEAVRDEDVLVFPENSHELLRHFEQRPNRKFVFCQNPFYAWRGLDGRGSYADYGVEQVLCVSQTTLHFLRLRMPAMPLRFTPYYVDHALFQPGPERLQRIVCVPRKRPLEMQAIRDLFRAWAPPQFASWPWAIVQEASERDVAQAMATSAVFLSLGRLEAHGMTALEAMASGCLVAGFHGGAGGSDSAHAGNGLWAPDDDIVGATRQLVQACTLAAQDGPECRAMVARGRQTAGVYRREHARSLLLEAWDAILPAQAPGTATP